MEKFRAPVIDDDLRRSAPVNLRTLPVSVEIPRVVRPARLDRSSTPDALRDELRRQILSGDIPSGARLVEADIADAFGVSRQTLRSALAELVHEGILRHAPNRGVWVPLFTADDIRDVFYMRGLVEGEAAARIAAVPERGRLVQPALDRLQSLADLGGAPGFGDAHTGFHEALVEAAGSPRLTRAYQQLRSESALCLIASRTESCSTPASQATAHQALLDTIVAGPPRAARRAAIAHLESGMRTALAAVGDQEGPEVIPARQVARSRR